VEGLVLFHYDGRISPGKRRNGGTDKEKGWGREKWRGEQRAYGRVVLYYQQGYSLIDKNTLQGKKKERWGKLGKKRKITPSSGSEVGQVTSSVA